MATKVALKEKEEKKSIPFIINEFLFKYRKIILFAMVMIFAVLLAVITYIVIVEKKNTAATTKIEDIIESWDTVRLDKENNTLTVTEDSLLDQLKLIIKKNSGLSSAARANLVVAEIYQSRKDWKNAKDFYIACAKTKPTMYMAPLGYYNAAVCAEELGEADQAVVLYTKAFDHDSFKMKSRALFNIGRVQEQRGNRDLAIESYEKMVEKYPDDSWTLLAQSRVIALEIQ